MSPIPFHHEVTSREIEAARASVAPLSGAVARAKAEAGEGAVVLAWLSDLHILARHAYCYELGKFGTHVDCSANLQLALAELAALDPQPDLLVLGGDLTDSSCGDGGPLDEYLQLKSILDAHLPPGLPTLPILGNHDHGDCALSPRFFAELPQWRRDGWPASQGCEDFFYSVERQGFRFVALDSRFSQAFSVAQRALLENALRDDTPTIVLCHRPFITCGNWVDEYRCTDAAVLDIINRAPNARACFSGHTHKAAARRMGGATHVIFPAVAYGIDDGNGWGCAVLSPAAPPAVFAKYLAHQAHCSERGENRVAGAFVRLS